MQATYSPEDNKLRFYPDGRLNPEDYARIKTAGFKWAPAQKLFVAPAWSPSREDLMIEWAGEVGDEDTSLVDRAEERAERALYLAEQPVRWCTCPAGYIFCSYDRVQCPFHSEPIKPLTGESQ